jgi:4-hydroxy-tetrahydrodipicolinate synthase
MTLAFSGIVPPMITPLDEHERVDQDGVARVAEHLIAHGVDGLFVFGTGGEGPVVRESERAALIRASVQAAAGRVPILVGCMATSTLRTLDYIFESAALGADAAVVTPSFYYAAPSQSVLYDHFAYLAEHSPLPILMYNIPGTTHNTLEPETAVKLAALDKIVGLKDSSGNMEAFRKVLAERPADVCVFQGSEAAVVDSLAAGCDGLVLGSCNVMVDAVVALYRAMRSGDEATARVNEAKIAAYRKGCYMAPGAYWLSSLKMAMHLQGLCGPTTTRPILPVTEAHKAEILATLVELGIVSG